jgi:hypothetical protein
MCFNQELLAKIVTKEFDFISAFSVFVSSTNINLEMESCRLLPLMGRYSGRGEPLKCCSDFNIKFPPAASIHIFAPLCGELSLRLTARKTQPYFPIYTFQLVAK